MKLVVGDRLDFGTREGGRSGRATVLGFGADDIGDFATIVYDDSTGSVPMINQPFNVYLRTVRPIEDAPGLSMIIGGTEGNVPAATTLFCERFRKLSVLELIAEAAA